MKKFNLYQRHITMEKLCEGALFFSMSSCEYSKTRGTRKTKILTIENIRFSKINENFLKWELIKNLF